MNNPVPVPTVDRIVAFADIPDRTFRITDILGGTTYTDGWGCFVKSQSVETDTGYTTQLLEAEYGTPTGWEYVR